MPDFTTNNPNKIPIYRQQRLEMTKIVILNSAGVKL